MLWCLVISVVGLSAAVQGRKISCDRVPDNGAVSISEEGVYTFSCVDSQNYVLRGDSTARCVDGVFDAQRLPACARTFPRTTSVQAKYDNPLCEESMVARRIAALTEALHAADCWRAGTCTWREAKHECSGDKLSVLILFTTVDDVAHNSIAAVTDGIRTRAAARNRNRQKRFNPDDFDDADTEDIDTGGCPSGSITNPDDTCSECTPGSYAPEDGTRCVECPKGQYQPSSAASECLPCPDGKTTESLAADDVSECIATCTLPNKVIDGKFVVDDLEKEAGESTPFGSTVTLLCDEGYKFNNSRAYSMDCKGTDSHFYNECYKITMLPEDDVYKFLPAQVQVTCRAKASHDIIGFHVVHSKSNFNVEASGERKYEGGVAEQQFQITSDEGAVEDIKCMADVKEDFFETSDEHITVALVDMSISPESGRIANVGDSVEVSALVTYNSKLKVSFSWTKDDESESTFSTSEDPLMIDGSQFFKSAVSLVSINFDDAGVYSVTVKVADASGNNKLDKVLKSEVTVRGFTRQPSDENDRTHIVNIRGESVKLTCSYKGLADSESLQWVNESHEVFYKDWQTSEKTDGITTSILQFEKWPGTLADGKLMCAVFNGDMELITESEQVTLQSHDYDVKSGPNVNAIWGDDAELVCTASSPLDLEYPPTMTWYKKNDEDDDKYLPDGYHFITNNKQKGARVESLLTIAAADQNDIGDYYCKAQYGYEVEDGSKLIEIMGDPITLSITGFECEVSQENMKNGRVVDKWMEGGRLTLKVECDPGYWFSKGSGNLLYCNETGSPVYPECERVIIKTHMVEHDGGYHLLEVSYSSKSWNGNGTLCDDGWDNREAEIVCKQNGFNHGKAVSLMTKREDFVLTELDCPCGETGNLEHCSATRYEVGELPCMPGETAGVRCYNESLEVEAKFLKARSAKKTYKFTLQMKVYKHGEPLSLAYLDSSSFALKSPSAELDIKKAGVKIKEGAAITKLVARKPKGYKSPTPHCLTLEVDGPIKDQKFEIEHCFS